jgi:ABC-type bacteriocin/lantibiotic exporter with double-glycine peptidase domain
MDRTGVEAQMALRNLLVDPLIQVVGICSAAAAIISQLRDIHLPGARWIITGIALIFGALPAWVITRKSQVIVRESQANLQRFRFELGTLVNGVAGAPDEIQAMDAQRIFSSKYKDSVERFRKAEVKQSLVMEGVNSALQVPGVFATVLLLGLVVRQWYHGAGTELVAASIVLVQLLPRVMEPFRTLASLGILANVSWPAIATVLAVQDPPRPQRPESAQLVEKVSGTLEARNVRFAYDPQSKPVFDGLSFSALPGGITGLVARMGQGKTTFFRLVLRLYDPQSGEILLGGVPAQDLAPATVRQHVGMMSQNPAFFFDNVEENLRVASPTSTTEQITRLCQHTGLGPILENALGPDPLHRPFAAGAQLSGGQKKLFALTRCLLRDPKILLLDEPTTGMDNLEKFPLIEMMRTACAAKTVIVVDHDIPWLVKFCDHFVVLDAGRVVQQGTVQQLLEEGGLFKELHDKARQGCA